ncbi:hypothetical protein BRARA_D01654 [Brassica rapa]|uniref:DUF4283 domain-containing protein n=1 Tax=Brassica campestris TaxID=3711 RepID=A0A397ZM23_BRACM|nr:hypothetical protein BRARA_D01654 [Brassica rapa]
MADLLHNSLRAMKLDEEEPLTLPDSPRFRVYDQNSLSILGCLLNPDCQSMARMIEYMPTAWRVYDRVRGIALSKDRFQFIFQREEDLETVLKDRPWSYNHWAMALELFFTTDTMFKLASEVGKVEEIAYDPKVSHTKDYIRALITFSTDNPVKASRRLNMPKGEGSVLIEFEYEKIHKRKDYRAPKMLPTVQEGPQTSLQIVKTTGVSSVTLEVGPPGFPIMFPELSDQERRSAMVYVSHADETERNARIQRVRHTIDDSAKTPPVILTKISHDLDKGKGHVFSYPDISSRLQWPTSKKLQSTSSAPLVSLESEGEAESSSASLPVVLPPFDVTTGFQLGTSSMDPTTGNIKGGKKARRRPPSWKRKTQGRVAGTASNSAQKGDSYKENGTKRKSDTSTSSSLERSTKKQEFSVASGLKPLLFQ